MPQTNQNSASDNSVSAFMGLDEGKQRDVLGKMSPEAKSALLTGMRARKTAAASAPSTSAPSKLPAPPSTDGGGLGDTYAKLGRGAALGAASGLGIPESTDPKEVVGGAIKNTASGLYEAGKSILKDPIEGTAGVLHGMASNLEQSGGEAWQGYKNKDPEQFAHGLTSAITQILTLKTPEKADYSPLSKAGERTRLARTAAATGADASDLRPAMPEIVKQAQAGGVTTIGEFKDAVSKAKSAVDQKFNTGFTPIANKPYIPTEIARRIRNLITPDMAQTAEGREQIKEINRRAREYEKPWTLKQLNAKRITENENLTSFFNKDTRGQASAKLDTDISKAVRDGSADIVYDQWDRANPGQGAAQLKKSHGAMWALNDHLTKTMEALDTKQLQHEGKGTLGRVKPHLYGSGAGVHGYVSGVGDALSAGPEKVANKTIKKAFGRSLTSKAGKLGAASLPIAHLANPPEPARKTPFPPPPSTSGDDDDSDE